MLHEKVDKIRKLAVISLFYDDSLLDVFVLKGGNALNLVYGFNNRASIDIDVSMESEFSEDELEEVKLKLQQSFESVFGEEGFSVFDFKLSPTPRKLPPEYEGFWGGYTLEFKVIETERYTKLDIQGRRVQAVVIGDDQQKKFTIDISKYEYVEPKELAKLSEYSIYVYSPVMVIYEKLRAICQQMEDYGEIIKTHRRPRARDFYDIHSIMEGWDTKIDLYTPYNLSMINEIFSIKRVPLSFLGNIISQREYHREDFSSVLASIDGKAESYDYYFDYVSKIAQSLYERFSKDSEQIAATKPTP